MTQDINNNIMVTASSKGLGFAIAQKFSENNYGIILHGRDAEKIQEAKHKLDNVICTIQGDLREQNTIQKIYDSVLKYGISVLVNNAAIPCYGLPVQAMSLEQTMNSLETNLIAPILLIQKIYPLLKKQEYGSVININSIVGKEPKKHRSVHSATKWGLKGFSKSLRLEAQDDGIKIINVYPTRIRTVPEFTYGLEPSDVAQRIYDEYVTGLNNGELVIDGRPAKYRNSTT